VRLAEASAQLACVGDRDSRHGLAEDDNTSMAKHTSTKLTDDGLRYATRQNGSPFGAHGTMRSCFKCGKHRAPAQLQAKRFLGRIEMICKPSCDSVE
jgi:hypothetical protein